jgi:hypothetical protein
VRKGLCVHYTNRVPTFVIDLEENEYDRWDEVIDHDVAVVEKLAEEAEETYVAVSDFLLFLFGRFISIGHKLSGGYYRDEMKAWAEALGRPLREVVLMNCIYTLSHVTSDTLSNLGVFGCTTGVISTPKFGMVHARILDWPMRNIGKATRIFEFHEGARVFKTVGVAGYVGALSGMVPGEYSVTINWAPPNGRPTFDFEPSFLLREVLTTCDTYAEAVYSLTNTKISTPVFYTVCGTKAKQACIIERTQTDSASRRIKGIALVQGNHHNAKDFMHNNDDELYEDSYARVDTLQTALVKTCGGNTLEKIATCLHKKPINNIDSCQQMIFCPESGEMRVWRRIP